MAGIVPLVRHSSEGWPKHFQMSSSKEDSLPYDVSIEEDGFAVCTCHGYSYRRNCRHIVEARKLLGSKEPVVVNSLAVSPEVLSENEINELLSLWD